MPAHSTSKGASHTGITTGSLFEQIIVGWMTLNEGSSFPADGLQTWFTDYITSLSTREGSPTSHQLILDLLSRHTAAGGSLHEFFVGMFNLAFAIRETRPATPEQVEQLRELKELVLQDYTSQMVITYTELLEKQKKEFNTISTLLRVTKAASSSLDLEKVLQVISSEIVQALHARACNSFLFPEKSRIGNYYLLDVMPNEYIVPDPPEPFMLAALESGEPVICYDPALDPRTDKKTVEFFGLKSLLAFPLISKGKPIAAGLVVMDDYHHFTQAEIDLVMAIANSGALAVENARYHDTKVQLATSQERNLLAQELHDRIAQNLAVVKINLNSALMNDPDPPLLEPIQESKTLVDETYQDVRDAILGLRCLPKSISGSMEEVHDYLITYGAHHNLEIQFLVNERDFQVLDTEAVLQISRIVDEAVMNSCRHAKASTVWIRSGLKVQMFWLSVEDDGIGIDWEQVNRFRDEHFGLSIMQERARSVGGSLTITDRIGGGTCVTFEMITGVDNQ